MKKSTTSYQIIIPHTNKAGSKSYYSKALIIEDNNFDRIDEAMQEELLYGEVEYC